MLENIPADFWVGYLAGTVVTLVISPLAKELTEWLLGK